MEEVVFRFLDLSLEFIWGECVVHLGFRQVLARIDDVDGGQTGGPGVGARRYAQRVATRKTRVRVNGRKVNEQCSLEEDRFFYSWSFT